MKSIRVHYIDMDESATEQSSTGRHVLKQTIHEALEKISGVNRIDEVPWKDYPYLPEVTFKIARTAKGLLLKYNVIEEYIRAVHDKTNDPVYEDSCVEFFLSADKRHYYNFEFNCIGTALISFGTSREDRKWIEPSRIEQIKRFPSMGTKPFAEGVQKKGPYKWELSVYIPFSFFNETDAMRNNLQLRSITSRAGDGKAYRANFYKCGDKLPEPHYVSWNRIETEAPDFHRPEYFGELIFMD